MMTLVFIIFILLFIGVITENTGRVVPLVFVIFIALMFKFGISLFIFLMNNPLLLILVVGLYLLKKRNAPKIKKDKNFYYYSSSGSQEDFEEFFRKAGGYSGGSYSGNAYQGVGAKDEDYERLGIKKGATKEEVKRAYREQVKINHPDKFVSATESEKKYQENKIKEINESYEKISKELEETKQ